ncbi:Mg-protoporphyrin IX monomethyl ester oxidative cyclase [hydrothermal vent metagenome]|uniref:Mg-protoporphyrin IX monomethyl ester oxidative cyclase n=1 Tax=hydrothermal vent metagenome TaxID=652676 RepID=A0A3B0XPT0_9ZZZZ
MAQIILTTLNARYIHASMGLRYLFANMGNLQSKTELIEFNINTRVMDIAESLLLHNAKIIGIGVYIWNAMETLQLVKLLKTISPDTKIILGGPEVSYEFETQEIVSCADYLITGQAELTFKNICDDILNNKKLFNKIIHPLPFELSEIKLPYEYYNDEDVANRVIYVEASRGCPFKCEFCLSSLDKTVYPFNLDIFLTEMDKLYQRGVRHFKFVDRTFNLKAATSIRIMEFFLNKMDSNNTQNLFLHFELIPDHLPEKLKTTIARFPEGSLQFEIGIQSLNTEVQTIISRKQNTEKVANNLSWIRNHSQAHIHADLIIGLPGETIESFGEGLNQLYKMNPHEIQVGILKRLKGTPIIRHTEKYDMRYNPLPPFNILSNNLISFEKMQRMSRFARYWDLIINSGRFKNTKEMILENQAFENFLNLSNWIFNTTGQTHKISLERLYTLLYNGMINALEFDEKTVTSALLRDYENSGIKGRPKFLQQSIKNVDAKKIKSSQRQIRHSEL